MGRWFEVALRVQWFGDENVIWVIGYWNELVWYGDELLFDWTYQVKSDLEFLLRVIGFDSGADDGNIVVFFADSVNVRHNHDVYVWFSVALSLWDDDLHGSVFLDVWDWVFHDANAPDDLANLLKFGF